MRRVKVSTAVKLTGSEPQQRGWFDILINVSDIGMIGSVSHEIRCMASEQRTCNIIIKRRKNMFEQCGCLFFLFH